ncbi:hypothetical protein ACQVQY_31980 [Bacillus mycoides]|uniref:hypothetical protein n=1 Tax=Bacillus mycoides TaxID=1405 RepID=UPI003D64F800
MKKVLKFIIPCVCLIVTIVCINQIVYAMDKPKETPETIALKDYQYSKNVSPEDGKQLYKINNFTSNVSLKTSTSSFRIYETKQAKDITKSDSQKMSELLLPTDEKLWFIMNGDNPEGLIVTNDQEPIRMGGENRSKDLYKIYESVKSNTQQIKEIVYFEFEGQGLFIVSHEQGEDVYASEGASFILGIPSGQKLKSNEIISKMKERILILSKQE